LDSGENFSISIAEVIQTDLAGRLRTESKDKSLNLKIISGSWTDISSPREFDLRGKTFSFD